MSINLLEPEREATNQVFSLFSAHLKHVLAQAHLPEFAPPNGPYRTNASSERMRINEFLRSENLGSAVSDAAKNPVYIRVSPTGARGAEVQAGCLALPSS